MLYLTVDLQKSCISSKKLIIIVQGILFLSVSLYILFIVLNLLIIMLKKTDVLPLILALISTVIVILLGLVWFNKISNQNSGKVKSSKLNDSKSSTLDTATAGRENSAVRDIKPRDLAADSKIFPAPTIVPQGTSVRINGSTRMIGINQALKKSFQRQFPGTAILTNADGSETGIDLLNTGEIDIAAILRPLTEAEKTQGLATITVDESLVETELDPISEVFYYAYQKPANIEVEAFLGFALSPQGQKAITNP